MTKLKTIEDLKRIREQAQQSLKIRTDTGTTITVGMGTCGIAAGARDTMHAILDELARHNAHRFLADRRPAAREPLVDIQQAGRPRITYGNVMPTMVPRLIEEHLIQGAVIEAWVVARMEVEPAAA